MVGCLAIRLLCQNPEQQSSTLRYHSICRFRSCPSINTERHNRVLQYRTCSRREGWLALFIERSHSLCEEIDWLLPSELVWYDRKSTLICGLSLGSNSI